MPLSVASKSVCDWPRQCLELGDELPVAVLWLTDRNVLVKRQTRAVAGQDFRISRDKSN